MVKKKLTEKKLNKEELTSILRDACNSTSVELDLRDLLNEHHKEIREYLGVSPRTMRRYRGQLNDKVRQIEVRRKVRREELQRYSEKNDSLKGKLKETTEQKYSFIADGRDWQLRYLDQKFKVKCLVILWVVTALGSLFMGWYS